MALAAKPRVKGWGGCSLPAFSAALPGVFAAAASVESGSLLLMVMGDAGPQKKPPGPLLHPGRAAVRSVSFGVSAL